jgi:hypothetical protein
MEKNLSNREAHQQGNNPGSDAPGQLEFHVTYFDTDCGRIRTEVFETAAEAERFASRNIRDENGWAVVDAVQARRSQLAA